MFKLNKRFPKLSNTFIQNRFIFYFYALLITVVSIEFGMLYYFSISTICDNTYNAFHRYILDAIIVLLPYWVLPNKIKKWCWGIVFIIFIWILAQVLYVRTYESIMPFSSFLLVNNFSPLLFHSVIASFRIIDVYLFIPIVIGYFIYRFKLGKRVRETPNQWIWFVFPPLISLVLFVGCQVVLAVKYYQSEKDRIASNFLSRYTNSCGDAYYYYSNGYVAYFIYSVWGTIFNNEKLTEVHRKYIDDYIQSFNYDDNNYSIDQPKNVILIIVESLNTWTIDFKLDHQYIMPNLHELTKQKNVLYADKLVSQVKNGRSSDGHLIINTGLLPIENNVVTAVAYGDTKFPSLAKTLNYTESIEIIGDNSNFWNQNITYKSYGYDRLYDQNILSKFYKRDIKDREILDFAILELKKMQQPFLAQIVTITMHAPYYKLNIPITRISESKSYDIETLNYLEYVNYTDKAIGKFINDLKRSNLFDNSIVVITADHNEFNYNRIENRELALKKDKYCPLIILNVAQPLYYSHEAEQIDIYPTLLDVIGKNDYFWKGLGRSLYRKSNDTINYNKWDLSKQIIQTRYFDKVNINSF